MYFYDKAVSEKARLTGQINFWEKQIKVLPEGTLRIHKCGNSNKWYQKFPGTNKNQTRKYIPKDNRPLAEKLARKTYYIHQLEDAKHELLAINAYLSEHKATEETIAQHMFTQNGFEELLGPSFKPLDQSLREWMEAPPKEPPIHPEGLTVKSMAHFKVRSKSEASIISLLLSYNIPFRYEEPITINGKIYHPDFTIRHPKTGEYFYWEHIGSIDDIGYLRKNREKYLDYFQNGLIPTHNLIITFESDKVPFDVEYADELIKYYFL